MPEVAVESIVQLPLERIRASPHQARKTFSDRALRALAESLRHEGLIQPIVVRENAGGPYQLVSGERRLRAAKLLGWSTISARVIPVVSEGEAAAKGLVENLQRKNLNAIEEADGFAELHRTDPGYWTHERIAQVCGKDRSYVTRSLKLLTLPSAILDRVRQGELSRNHGIELSRMSDAAQQARLCEEVLQNQLTVAQTRKIVDDLQGTRKKRSNRAAESGAEAPSEEPKPDPLSGAWSDVLSHPAITPEDLAVEYRGENRWSFESPPLGAPVESLPSDSSNARALRNAVADWLARLADALRQRG